MHSKAECLIFGEDDSLLGWHSPTLKNIDFSLKKIEPRPKGGVFLWSIR
jgi:hypothetical protein